MAPIGYPYCVLKRREDGHGCDGEGILKSS
jgi:hypothetical protein